MALAHFRMINNELLNKDPDLVPEQAPIVILDNKSDMCMAKNSDYTKKHQTYFHKNALCKKW